jgi:CRISPR system Cascade subunit CasE
MAFPSPARKQRDPEFLAPFEPGDFEGNGRHVHVPRGEDKGFLFRVEEQPGGRAIILVHSAAEPDWSYAFANADYLLAAPPEHKQYEPRFSNGEHMHFRLWANPTKKIETLAKEQRQAKAPKRHGRRVPVPNDQLEQWLQGRAEVRGFAIQNFSLVQPGYIYVNKAPQDEKGRRYRGVKYEGIAKVTDAPLLKETLIRGIGPAKGFGFGLLSLAPAR